MLPPTTLQSRHPAEQLLDGSEAATLLLVAIVVLVLLSTGTIRYVPPGRLVVVLRRGVIRRIPRARFVVTVPGLDQVLGWPTAPVDEAMQIRSRTRDGAEVRVLAELSLAPPPPTADADYVEPISVAVGEIAMIIETATQERDLDDLLDPGRGLQRVLHGLRLASGTTIMTASIAEVEVLLGDRVEGGA